MYKWGYALEKLQFTKLDLQICNCKVAMLAFSGYKVPTLHLQNTKLHSSNFGLQVWNDITHMYIYGTTNHKYWFTNLQLHGCNVRILTPLAFHNNWENLTQYYLLSCPIVVNVIVWEIGRGKHASGQSSAQGRVMWMKCLPRDTV